MKRSTLVSLVVVSSAALLVAGCGSQDDASEGGGTYTDAAGEATLDGAGEGGLDGGVEDAPGDGGLDASADAPSEVSDDATIDGPTDGNTDGFVDGSLDAPFDSPADTATDGTLDAPFDGPIDAPADSPVDAPVDGTVDAPTDSPIEAMVDAPGDGPWDAPLDVLIDAPDATDSGAGDGEVWIEIDYGSAYTSQSPGWSYSATPGWGEAQWAPPGWSYPEAWDRFNNMTVEWDPMGSKALMIGGSSQLQLMIGLEELLSYSSATVRLEGRSYSTTSTVTFEVSNPINGCAVTGSMSNDWTIHVEELDFGQCLVAGTGLQAVRVDTLSGTLALVRMRVTLHDAAW
jgi:hypothetical protein